MPWQLVYTSAPRGLVSGQSGLCTVGRSADLRDALAQRLEQISPYHYLEVSTATSYAPKSQIQNGNPSISAYRILDLRGTKYHVLTRIQPSGLDFTARTNHLAHHLVFQPEELPRLPSPAVILRSWSGWLSSWQGNPRILEAISLADFDQVSGPTLPAKTWKEVTGDAGRAAGLLEGDYARGCYLVSPPGGEQQLLDLFCESLQLANFTGKTPLRSWQHTFTTFIQGEDVAADFQWRGCRKNSPGCDQAIRRGAALTELSAIRVPDNPLAKLAREGPKLPSPSIPSGAGRSPVRLRKDSAPGKIPLSVPSLAAARDIPRAPRPGVSNPVGFYLTINKSTVRWLGISAILLLLGLGILTRLGLFRNRSHPATSSVPAISTETNQKALTPVPSPSPIPSTTKQAKESVPEVVTTPSRLNPDVLNRELDPLLPDVPTYIIITPNFPAEFLWVTNISFYSLVKNVAGTKLAANQINVLFSRENWGLLVTQQMIPGFDEHERCLHASVNIRETNERFDFAFECPKYSGATENNPAVGVRVTSAKWPSKGFSMLFSPVDSHRFPAFRLLVINEQDAPPPLPLKGHFLHAHSHTILDAFQEPLTKRFDQISPLRQLQLQLRPYVRARDGQTNYLYRGLPVEEKLSSEAPLNFVVAAAALRTMLDQNQTNVSQCETNLNAVPALQPNVDLDLALGLQLGVTNADLHTFKAYAASLPPGTRADSNLYLQYLKHLSEQVRLQHDKKEKRAAPEGTAKSLGELNKFFTGFLDSKSLLTLDGTETNYLFAAWKNLQSTEQRKKLEQKKKGFEDQIRTLEERLAQVPSSLSQVAYVSLFVRGPTKPVEMIRFSGFSDSTP